MTAPRSDQPSACSTKRLEAHPETARRLAEMGADIALAHPAKQRIHERMEQHVGVA